MMPESMFESNPEPSDDTLDEVNQAIQAQRNEGYTNGEIAAKLGCTERTVERKLALIREIWVAE